MVNLLVIDISTFLCLLIEQKAEGQKYTRSKVQISIQYLCLLFIKMFFFSDYTCFCMFLLTELIATLISVTFLNNVC